MAVTFGAPSNILTCVRSTTKSVWRNGVLTTIPANELPYDFDPVTNAARGLLDEGAATNLALYSGDVSQASWFKNAVTVTGNAGVAPDGTTTAASVVEAAVLSRHTIGRQSVTVTADAPQTVAFDVKPLPGSAARFPVIYMSSGGYQGANRAGVCYDLSAKAYTAFTVAGTGPVGYKAGITALANGWYRIWVSGTIGAADSVIDFYLSWRTGYVATNVGASYTGDGVSGFYVTGCQIEDNTKIPSSYIPVPAGTAVSRSADVISFPTSAISDISTASTVYVEYNCEAIDPDVTNIALHIGTGGGFVRVIAGTSGNVAQFAVRSGGADQAVISPTEWPVPADGATVKIAASSQLNEFIAALNGVASTIDSSGVMPSPATTIYIGSYNGANALNGHIRRVGIKPGASSTIELIDFSTL